ncbi:laccase-like [Venturia canescens]|uniref:laccase-like n=1 Tax=Venturia canescens TaxID=32260 RepID=UPI001C9C37B8|nr:laccase-like [Venturia canescens]
MKLVSISVSISLIFLFGIYDSKGENDEIHAGTKVKKQKLSTPEECARQCTEGEEPKTCHYHFTVEYFATLTKACTLCTSNTTTRLVPDCQCVTADGYETSSILTANRMFPGPAIMVCQNDYVVVDVTNRIPGTGLTIHWHGLLQKNYQHYDGVPYITQCPIQEGTTFRYQFRANNAGTHFWHSHVALQKVDGLVGPLIVRRPKNQEPFNNIWDFDGLDNVIMVTDFIHEGAGNRFPGTLIRKSGQLPDSFFINGLGQWTDTMTGTTTNTPLARFNVTAGHRYRFRMINSCGFTCAVQMTIEGHNLTVIATDGIPIKPVLASSITSSSAERYDFILDTDKEPKHYWIQLRALGACGVPKIQQLAILSYDSAPARPDWTKPTYDVGLDPGIILNALNVRCDDSENSSKFICLDQLESAEEMYNGMVEEESAIKLYVPFGFHTYSEEEIFKAGTYKRFLVANHPIVALVGNISNVLPPSPYLSQRLDIPEDRICSSNNLPLSCQHEIPCNCYHLEKIPLNSLVEIVLIDEAQIPGLSHPFHLHGHIFHIINEGRAKDHNITSISLQKIIELDRNGMLKRNFKKQVSKDTYAVPNNGYSIIRFRADNPGYWLFHCHFVYHLEVGMGLVFQVGEHSDMPKTPEHFPKCNNFVPQISDPYEMYQGEQKNAVPKLPEKLLAM